MLDKYVEEERGQRCTIAVPDMIVEMDPVGDQLSISVPGLA